MENIIVISLISTFLFCLAKLVEVKFLTPQNDDHDDDDHAGGAGGIKPLKFLIRDALIVFISSMISTYIYFHVDTNITNLLHILTETKTIPEVGASEIFTGQPDF